MSDDLRALRTLAIVLLVSGLARLGWSARAGEGIEAGTPVAVAPLTDSAARLEAEAARRSAPLGPDERLDPNLAPEAELDRLPGIGPALAARWAATRAETGGFRTPEDLLAVPGIGEATLARVRPFLADPPWGGANSAPGARSRPVRW